MCAKTCCLAICIGIVSQIAWAQPAVPDRQQQAEELRQQIERMEQKLRGLEESDKAKRGITQIGGTTVRLGDETRLIVRMYDLSELFTVAPAYVVQQSSDLVRGEKNLFPQVQVQEMAPAATGGFGGGLGGLGGAFSVPDRPRTVSSDRPPHLAQVEARTSVGGLMQTIQSVISPSSWDSNGGTMSISQLANALVVSADANTHAQIEKRLELFSKRWGTLKTVSVRAWWLPLTEEQLAELLEGQGAAKERPFGTVADDAFKKALDRQKQGGEPFGYRAAITCYNGQTVGVIAGDQSIAVTDIRAAATKGNDGSGPVTYSPEVSLIQEGAALQVTPIVTTSGKYVVLDIHSRVNRRVGDDRRAATARRESAKSDPSVVSAAEVVAALDRPRLSMQRLSTTLRVPIDRTVLIGGMTMSGTATASDPTLYLFVRLVVQELRDGLDDQPPDETKGAANTPAQSVGM